MISTVYFMYVLLFVHCVVDLFSTDIDECSSADLNECDGTCININGSYICSCPSGYYVDLDGHTCVGMLEYMEGVVLTSHVCTLVQDDHVRTPVYCHWRHSHWTKLGIYPHTHNNIILYIQSTHLCT